MNAATADIPVFEPGSEAYDAARACFNLIADQRPAAIAVPEDAEGVAAAVRYARSRELRVAPQTTGHNALPLGSLEDTLLVRTTDLRSVEIDATAQSARTGAGARWEDVVPAASDAGLAALHGSSPDVGVTGYTLGGGMGWYVRKHGLACNSLTAVDLVTAGGDQVRATRDSEPELFWALRGGGGNFGVATALEFDLFPVDSVYAGALFFPWERSAEVLKAWREWTFGVPDEVTDVGRILQFPPFPEIPEPMRGKQFVVIEAAFLGDEAGGTELMRPLRELGPAMDTFAMVPPAGLAELHMDPRDPVPYLSTHRMLGDLDEAGIDALVEVAGPESGSRLIGVELRQCGGALDRPDEAGGALASLPGSFAMFGVGIAEDPPAVQKDLDRVTGALAPYECGNYFNFAEEAGEVSRFFGEDVLERVRAVKAQYDPDNVIRANHPID